MKLKEDLYKKALELLQKEIKKYKTVHKEIDYREILLKYRVKTWKPFIFRIYEKLCRFSYNILKISKDQFDKSIYKDYLNKLEYLELDIYPEEILSFAYLEFFIVSILLPILITFLTFNIFLGLITFVLGFLLYFVILNLPSFLYWYRLIKSLDQSVLATLYLVVYIDVNPNLENALLFTSKYLGGPLGRDFYRIVWYSIIKKYSSVEEGLLDYINRWKLLKPDFVEAINVIISSIKQKDKENRKVMLEKAMEIVLNGTYRQLLRFSAQLKLPVTALYMIGLTLPLLILILMPILISFSGGSVDLNFVMIIYDIILPILIFTIGMYMFSKKPLGFSPPSLKDSPYIPRLGYFWVYVGNKKREINGLLIFFAIFIPLMIPSILYAKQKYIDKSLSPNPELEDVLYALPIIIGLGIGSGLYFIVISKEGIMETRRLESLEDEYRMAIFNLAMKIEQGYPIEIAIEYVVKSISSDSQIKKFFEKILENIRKFGVDLYTAVFHKKFGAIREYPSNIIKSTMILFINASRKSTSAAAKAMRFVSEYLLKVNDVKEKFKDILYDVLSSLNFQTSYVAPMVIAVVVSLNALIVVIMQKVSSKAMSFSEFTSISSSNDNTFGFGEGVPAFLQFFAFGGMVPLFHFTLYTYLFLYISTIIVGYVMKEIESGSIYDFFSKTGKMLITSTLFFVGVTIALTMIFGNIFISLSTLFGGL